MNGAVRLVTLCVVSAGVIVAGCPKQEPSPPPVAPPPPTPRVGEERPAAKTAEEAPLQGKSVVMIVASKDYRDEELDTPRTGLEDAGHTVTVASSSLDTATGTQGGSVEPDVLLKDVSADEYDAVVFVGGPGAKEYWDNETAHALAKSAVEQGKVLAAICIAPVTLAKAGVLGEKRATVWSSESKQLEDGGATYVKEPVVVDGNIITADGPDAAKAFGDELVKALSE